MYDERVSAFSSIDPSILVNVVSDDTTALLAGFGGALLGSVVSAFFSWLLHNASVKREIENENRQRVSNERAVALSALVRLQSLINLVIDLRNRIVDCLAEAEAAGHGDFQAWQKVVPIAGLPQVAAPFDVTEISLLLAAKHPETANELIRFHSRVESVVEAMRTYNILRSKLKDLMPANVTGRLGISSISLSDYAKTSSTIAECQDLLGQILSAVAEDCPKGIEVSELLTSNLERFPFMLDHIRMM